MRDFYQSKREQKYQAEMAELFSDIEPPVEQQREDSGEFSLEPISFEELTESLCRDAEALFRMTSVQHRLSESFLVSTGNLEKLIRRLGSCCLTKAALEAKGRILPKLEGLDIQRLYCLGSFNFRKCHASLRDGISKVRKFNMDMMNMECSWCSTLERLRSTEERITLIREGKIDVDSLIRRDSLFRESSASSPHEKDSRRDGFGKAASFPILRAALEGADLSADLTVGTSRVPKERSTFDTPGIFKPITPAQIRRERAKEMMKREAAEKAREKEEAEKKSKKAVKDAVAAIIAQKPKDDRQENIKTGNAPKPQAEKSAAQKWAEILGQQSRTAEKPPGNPAQAKHGKKKRKK